MILISLGGQVRMCDPKLSARPSIRRGAYEREPHEPDAQRGPRAKSQQGVMLLEALVAILIFTIGIIAVMGMQVASITQVTQAKYRTDARYLANQIIGQDVDRPAQLLALLDAGLCRPRDVGRDGRQHAAAGHGRRSR